MLIFITHLAHGANFGVYSKMSGRPTLDRSVTYLLLVLTFKFLMIQVEDKQLKTFHLYTVKSC